MQDTLAGAWGKWLEDYDWSHWCTLTFRRYEPRSAPGLAAPKPFKPRPGPPPDYAHRSFDRFARRLANKAVQRVWWFRGDELGPQLGRLHLHALVGGTEGLLPETLRSCWREGFSFIDIYDPELGAAHYLTKYVSKDLADYDLSGGLRARGSREPRLELATSGLELAVSGQGP